jgi:hypothetical protein
MIGMQVKNCEDRHMAAEIGGGLDGSPMQSRIFLIASGGLIAHSILIRLPQESHFKTSKSKDRLIAFLAAIFRISFYRRIC